MVETLIGIAGLALGALALALERGWLPPKHHMVDPHPMQDPLAARVLGPPAAFEQSPRMPRVVVRHMLPQYEADGFRVVRVAFGREFRWGRECVWTGKVSDGSVSECVLVARPAASPSPRAAHPSGQEPVIASSAEDIPFGIDPARVGWARPEKAARRRLVLDSQGRPRKHGDLTLVYRDN